MREQINYMNIETKGRGSIRGVNGKHYLVMKNAGFSAGVAGVPGPISALRSVTAAP